ncbi:MAG: hypothetical protein ACTSRG_25890 [Candidatus Helarchaeota archaeon]
MDFKINFKNFGINDILELYDLVMVTYRVILQKRKMELCLHLLALSDFILEASVDQLNLDDDLLNINLSEIYVISILLFGKRSSSYYSMDFK